MNHLLGTDSIFVGSLDTALCVEISKYEIFDANGDYSECIIRHQDFELIPRGSGDLSGKTIEEILRFRGWRFSSQSYPQIINTTKTFYVCGSDKQVDDVTTNIYCSYVYDLTIAINELNSSLVPIASHPNVSCGWELLLG